MKKYFSIGHRLPHFLAAPLFGDRRRFGLKIQRDDPDWLIWQKFYQDFYQRTQKQGVGKVVNDAGYKIFDRVDLVNKQVLEFGPGTLPHISFWRGTPASYTLVDNIEEMLNHSKKVLTNIGVSCETAIINSFELPFDDEKFDVIVSFYSLEHLYPLENYLLEISRVLKPGGLLVGGIPTEGGVFWGLGRFFTTRRFIKQNSTHNPDKVICWEHPNFAEDILTQLDESFLPRYKSFWPMSIPFVDVNMIIRFIYEKKEK